MNRANVELKCKDLKTGTVQWRRTHSFLAWTMFFGLQRDHTYEITAPDYGKAEKIEVKISRFVSAEDLCI